MKEALSIYILLSFLITGNIGPMPAYAQEDFRLPAPGVMVHLSPEFDPPILKGIKVHPDNPFHFDFILDRGDGQLSNDALKNESGKLIKYFLASLTIPEKDLWVNLSPYEKDRIVPQSFGLTEMGRDLLAEDYMLKQITASLIYPEDGIGKKFWKRIYEEAEKKFGTTNIPVNTFNKVWIVPEKAVVYENAKAGTAYVVESKLKVMLEQDYLSLQKHEGISNKVQAQDKTISQLGSQIVREVVIPQLTKEVNEDKNFSQLRQVYNSLILATWYKKKIKDSILEQVYTDKNKVAGVNIDDPQEKQRIYERYLQAFKKGVYNYIKEEIDPAIQQTIPRKYFSGGIDTTRLNADQVMSFTTILPVLDTDRAMVVYGMIMPVLGTHSIPLSVILGAGVLSAMGTMMALKRSRLLKKFPKLRTTFAAFLGLVVASSLISQRAHYFTFDRSKLEAPSISIMDFDKDPAGGFGGWLSKEKYYSLFDRIQSSSGPKLESVLDDYLYRPDQWTSQYWYSNDTERKVLVKTTKHFLENTKIFVGLSPRTLARVLEAKNKLIWAIKNTRQNAPKDELVKIDGDFPSSWLNKIINDTRRKIQVLRAGFPPQDHRLFSFISAQPEIDFELNNLDRIRNNQEPLEKYIEAVSDTLPSVKTVEDPGTRVYSRFNLFFGNEKEFQDDSEALETAVSAPVHSIPVSDVQRIRELRKIPQEYKVLITQSAARHNIPAYWLIHSMLVGSAWQRKYSFGDNIEHTLKRLGSDSIEVDKFLPKKFYETQGLDSKSAAFVGAMLGAKPAVGPTLMRPVWVRRANGFRAFGENAKTMSDQRISWLLLDPKYSIEGTAAVWEEGIRVVSESRSEAIEGRQVLGLGSFAKEARERVKIIDDPKMAKLIPDPRQLRDDQKIILLAFHPQAEWFLGRNEGQWHREDQHHLLKVKIMQEFETIVSSGITDDRPAEITGASSEQLRVLLNDPDAYIRDAAKRALTKLGGYLVAPNDKIASGLNSLAQVKRSSGIDLTLAGDRAMNPLNKGGIDLTLANKVLKTQNNGGEIKFHLDPAMLRQLQNAPGFVPVIISIQPMVNLRKFLSAV